jgi:hypothetical protein
MNNIFSTKLFSHNADDRTFVAEASDLQFSHVPFINLKSAKTGQEVAFEYVSTQRTRDADNEIESWTYKLWPMTADKFPGLTGYTVVILND